MEFIMNSIDYEVYIVTVFTGNMHIILAVVDLAGKCFFFDSVSITMYNVILQFIYY